MFFKWLWENQANEAKCEQAVITPVGNSATDFEEFPHDEALAGFDAEDRKFVAVALASEYDPTILNAVDSDWWNHRQTLKKHGIKVEFLCPDQFSNE